VVGKDAEIVDGMVDLIQNANSDVHFLALDNVDHVGHRTGFSLENPEYVDAIKMVDQQLGRLLSAIETRQNRLDEEWMVLITSDHGGEGTSHGALNEACRTIPLLIWGDTVVPGELDAGSHLDVHPTLMMHMGFHPEEAWALDGQVRGLADEA